MTILTGYFLSGALIPLNCAAALALLARAGIVAPSACFSIRFI
jgi:hypothetical protein